MLDKPVKVLVCHPGRQYSHQLAMALANAGMLAKYITGVPAHGAAFPVWQRLFLSKQIKAFEIPIEPALVRHYLVAPIARRIIQRVASTEVAAEWSHRAEGWFDRIAAKWVKQLRPDIVVCYENAALETFRIAKTVGTVTVLDAASFHHSWQDKFHRYLEANAAHVRICRRKDAEIELADHVLTVSKLARESYVAAGCASSKVTAIPLGVSTNLFRLGTKPRDSNKIRFVFIGQISERKGADLLRLAAIKLAQRNIEFELTLFGKSVPGFSFERIPGCHHGGWLSHVDLAEELVKHDVLVLPSRHDSFGMVVAEAMACGLPAIVSENVGAKEMVTEGETGHIIPTDNANDLANAMCWYAMNIDRLPAMRQAARGVAEEYDWSHYHQRIVEFLGGLKDADVKSN